MIWTKKKNQVPERGIKPNKAKMDLEDKIWQEKCFIWKVAFFQKHQLGIGIPGRKRAEIGQKLDFRALKSTAKELEN